MFPFDINKYFYVVDQEHKHGIFIKVKQEPLSKDEFRTPGQTNVTLLKQYTLQTVHFLEINLLSQKLEI